MAPMRDRNIIARVLYDAQECVAARPLYALPLTGLGRVLIRLLFEHPAEIRDWLSAV